MRTSATYFTKCMMKTNTSRKRTNMKSVAMIFTFIVVANKISCRNNPQAKTPASNSIKQFNDSKKIPKNKSSNICAKFNTPCPKKPSTIKKY